MAKGNCKLCLGKDIELRDSHYIPKGVYRRNRSSDGNDPIVMTRELILGTSVQVHAHVFCGECEQRLSAGGEKYVLGLISWSDTFLLRDKLIGQRPSAAGPFIRFSGIEARVDTEKLAYFAISMLWRGAVHPWKTVVGQKTGVVVETHMEEMRRYLLGETPMPSHILVFVVVCLDELSQLQVLGPFLIGEETSRFEMLMNGVLFQVNLGRPANEVAQLCCVHSPDRAVFAGDCHEANIQCSHEPA